MTEHGEKRLSEDRIDELVELLDGADGADGWDVDDMVTAIRQLRADLKEAEDKNAHLAITSAEICALLQKQRDSAECDAYYTLQDLTENEPEYWVVKHPHWEVGLLYKTIGKDPERPCEIVTTLFSTPWEILQKRGFRVVEIRLFEIPQPEQREDGK